MSRFVASLAVLAGLSLLPTTAMAADYAVPRAKRAVAVAKEKNPYCGCQCGCPIVRYVRHRELVMGYPSSFDPRTFDGPRFYYGRMKTYARFENNVVRQTTW